MRCSRCNGRLITGEIGSSHNMIFRSEERRFSHNGKETNRFSVYNRGLLSAMLQGYWVQAYYCPECKTLTIPVEDKA